MTSHNDSLRGRADIASNQLKSRSPRTEPVAVGKDSSSTTTTTIASVPAFSLPQRLALSPKLLASHSDGEKNNDSIENKENSSSAKYNSMYFVNSFKDIDKIKDMKHWSQIVATEFGYELFINYSQLEFCIENLLFLTEYMQLKDVLKRKFSIFLQLWNYTKNDRETRKRIGFNINFPSIDDGKYGQENRRLSIQIRDNHDAGHGYPVSIISKKLFNDLDVLSAFKALYYKYVDSSYAPFMINISSPTREKITMSLDHKYYKRHRIQRDTTTEKSMHMYILHNYIIITIIA